MGHAMETRKNAQRVLVRRPKQTEHLENLAVNGE